MKVLDIQYDEFYGEWNYTLGKGGWNIRALLAPNKIVGSIRARRPRNFTRPD